MVSTALIQGLTAQRDTRGPDIVGAVANGQKLTNNRLTNISLRDQIAADQTAQRRQEEIQRIIALTPPDQRGEALMQAGDIKTGLQFQRLQHDQTKFGAEQEQYQREQAELAAQQQRQNAFFSTLPPDQQALAQLDPGTFTEKAIGNVFKEAKPAQTRKLEDGGQIITQEWNPETGRWEQISSAPRWAPERGGGTASEFGLNPLIGTNPDGSMGAVQLSKDGTVRQVQLPEGFQLTPGVGTADLGTSIQIFDKRSGAQVATFEKDLRGAEEEKGIGKAQSDLVTNYGKNLATQQSLQASWEVVDRSIDAAIEQTNAFTAGTGVLLSSVPGTPGYNLARTLDTIKANVGFDKLQSMRDNSPTGGALGQVSEFENRLLQSVKGSLDQGQMPDQLRANLTAIKSDLASLRVAQDKAFQDQYRAVNQKIETRGAELERIFKSTNPNSEPGVMEEWVAGKLSDEFGIQIGVQ